MKTKDTNTDIDIEPAEEAVVNEALKDVADAMSSPNAYKHLMASDFVAMPLRPKMQLFARLHQLLSFTKELIGADVHLLDTLHGEYIALNDGDAFLDTPDVDGGVVMHTDGNGNVSITSRGNVSLSINGKPHTTVADHPFMGVDFVCGNGKTSLTTSIIDHLIHTEEEE